MNSELYMSSKVISIMAMLFLELLNFTRVEILVARVKPTRELPQPFIPPSQTHSVKWGTYLLECSPFTGLFIPKQFIPKQFINHDLSEIIFLLKLGKYLRVYRPKSCTLGHKKDKVVEEDTRIISLSKHGTW